MPDLFFCQVSSLQFFQLANARAHGRAIGREPVEGAELEIARGLLHAKVSGQAGLVGELPGGEEAGPELDRALRDIETGPELSSLLHAEAQAALRALKTAFGHEPTLMREGGSIPIVTDFKKILGADALLLGLALPDDNPHSPNEKFSLVQVGRQQCGSRKEFVAQGFKRASLQQ